MSDGGARRIADYWSMDFMKTGEGAEMNLQALRDARRNWSETGERAARSRALLSLEEVRESDLPAFFFDYDEHLLYLDGELFDLGDGEATWMAGSHPLPLPHQILEEGVGIEFGWRHTANCACRFCGKRAPQEQVKEAVA
jgi:hypothetical protein